MLSFPQSSATLTRSTGKPGDFTCSKYSTSMACTEATTDGRGGMHVENSGTGQGTWMLDEMSSTIDHARPANDYEAPTPYETPFSITTTAFAEDFCVVQDEEPVYANIQ